MKIYRYEHRDFGMGPYHTGLRISRELLNQDPTEVTHLTWERDENLREIRLLNDNAQWQAAFASRRDLALWFEGYHEELIQSGFLLVCLEVPTTAVRKAYRGHQVAYHSRKAHDRVVLVPSTL